MATSRDAKLVLSVEALGQENISKLQKSLQDLAAQGGESAAEFSELADQIGRLGDQQDALQAFKVLRDSTDELSQAQAQAKARVDELGQTLAAQKAVVASAQSAYDQAREAVTQNALAAARATSDIAALKLEYDAAGRKTTEYINKLRPLVEAQNAAREAAVTLRAEVSKAGEAFDKVEREQTKVEAAYKRATTQYEKANAALKASSDELVKAGDAASALGVDIANLGDAEARLVQVFSQSAEAAERRKQELNEMAEATRLYNIQQAALAAELKKGEAALWAEEAALRDAAKAAAAYDAAKAKAVADNEAWQKEAEHIVETTLATQRAAEATRKLSEEMVKAQQNYLFENQALKAQELARQAAITAQRLDDIKAAFAAADAEADELAAATERVNDAFKALSIRPIQEVEREIEETRAAMQMLADSGRLTGGALSVAMQQSEARVKALQREMRELTGSLTTADKAADLFKNSMGQIAAGNLIADAIGSLVEKVKEMGRAFVVAVVELDQMRRGLNAIYKDAAVTARQIEFLRKSAKDAGVSVGSLSGEFVRFSASMKSANVPIEQSNALFASLTKAAASLGLNADAVSGALNALGQMASKGTVSLEELRQQLGDRLPGALGLTAKGFGITEAELIKLVESGQLATRDFIVPFTQALTTMHGETTGLMATWNSFKNMLTNVSQTTGDAGGIEVMIGALKLLKATVGIVIVTFSTWFTVLTGIGKAIGVLGGAIATLSNPMSALAEIIGSVRARFWELRVAFEESIGLSSAQATASTRLAEKMKLAADETKNLAQSEKMRQLGALLLKSSTEDLSAALVQYQVASAKALSEQTKLTEALGKEAKAIKDQGDAKVRVAKLSGDAAAATQAEAQASEAYAAALLKESASKQEELRLIEQEIAFTKANMEARKLDAKAAEDQTAKLREKQTITQAEAAQAREAAEAARTAAVQRRLEAEAIGDQSKSLDDLRAAMVLAQAQYVMYQDLAKDGLALEKDVQQARENLAKATYRVRDAENDRAKAAQLAIDNLKTTNDLAKAGLELEMAVLRSAEAKARADGNEYELKRILIQQKELEIRMVKLTMEAKVAETNATIANLNVKKAEIALNDPLREQKIAAIDLSIKAAEADILRAKAAGEVVSSLERELKAIKDGTAARNNLTNSIRSEGSARSSATAATNNHADAIEEINMKYRLQAEYSERQIELLNRETEAAERAAEAYRKKWNVDKEGFSQNTAGERVNASMPSEAYIKEVANANQLTAAQTVALIDEYFRNGRATGFNAATAGRNGETWFTQVTQAAAKMNTDNLRRSAAGGDTSPTSEGSSTSGSGSLGRATKTININLRGSTAKVNVADEASADALVGLLRQLESEGRTAN